VIRVLIAEDQHLIRGGHAPGQNCRSTSDGGFGRRTTRVAKQPHRGSPSAPLVLAGVVCADSGRRHRCVAVPCTEVLPGPLCGSDPDQQLGAAAATTAAQL
jgi:hypothetical protein